MVPEEYVRKAESIIGHEFVFKRYIHDALTAAGAEKENHDGNRKLSQVGDSLIHAILASIIYGTDASRESSKNLRENFKKKENYEAAARQTGIDQCICYNERTETRSSGVLRKALNAIIAAVFLDTWNPKFTFNVILHIFTHHNIPNYLLPIPSTPKPATNSLSDGVDLFLEQSIGKSRCNRMVDGKMTGEFLNNASDPYLLFGAQLPLFPAFAPPFMGPSHGVTGWTGTEPVLIGDDWLICSEIQQNFETGGLIGGLVEIKSPARVTDSINQQYMPLETNVESFQQDKIDYITSGSGFCEAILSTDINMPLTSSPNNCLEDSNRHLANPRKRKRATEDSSSQSKGNFLQNHLSQERRNCLLSGMLPPEETYFSLEVQNTIIGLGSKHYEALLTRFATIASSRSILALRDLIRNERNQRSPQSYLLGNKISRQRRYHMIQELDQRASFMQLMKWLHVLELFQDCGGPGAQSYTGYIVSTPDSFGNHTKMPGNQRNREDNQVTLSMMSEVFPDIIPESNKRMLKTFNKLRKLGKRLHTLSSKFGKGIFGLMLDCVPNNDRMAILNNIFLDLNDPTFSTIVNLLEASQGKMLREFSAAILPLLDSITNSMVHSEQQYKLESVDDESILSKPKGSSDLLHLIS